MRQRNAAHPDAAHGTHFRILVVSNAFSGVPAIQRIRMVLDTIIPCLADRSFSERTRSDVGPSRRRKYGTEGLNVRELPEHIYVAEKFVITCKTPAQWKPQDYVVGSSDMFGSSRVQMTSIGTNPKAFAHAKDVSSTSLSDEGVPDALNWRHSVVSVAEVAMAFSADESSSSQPKEKSSLAASAFTTKDDLRAVSRGGGMAKAKFIDRHRAETRAARVLQRRTRERYAVRGIRYRTRLNTCSTTISRVYRGYIGRAYAREFKRVRSTAGTFEHINRTNLPDWSQMIVRHFFV